MLFGEGENGVPALVMEREPLKAHSFVPEAPTNVIALRTTETGAGRGFRSISNR
jgi:hypothetical protein